MATPETSVMAVAVVVGVVAVALVTEPPPVVTAKVTVTPFTGWPSASLTTTLGGVPTATPTTCDWSCRPAGATAIVSAYENSSPVDAAVVPARVVTVTSTVPAPAAAGGTVATIVLLLGWPTTVAGTPPNLTAWPMFFAVERLMPVIVTAVPPSRGPLAGLTLVTVAGA